MANVVGFGAGKNFDGAVAEAEKAKALAPYDTFMLVDLSFILTQAGRPQKASEWLDTVGARDPALGWFSNLGKVGPFLLKENLVRRSSRCNKPNLRMRRSYWR